MQKSTIFPEIKTGWQFCFFLLLCPLCLWCQSAVNFEKEVIPVDPGKEGWQTEPFPPEYREIDFLHMEGLGVADTLPPRVSAWSVENGLNVNLVFSEAVNWPDSLRVVLLHNIANNDQSRDESLVPDSVSFEENKVYLFFAATLPNREELDLLLGGICDWDGNLMSDTVLSIMRNDAVWGDMVINELMVDPEPVTGVYLGEYVELFNRSEYQLNTEDWILMVGNRKYVVDEGGQEGLLESGGYVLLTGLSLPNQGSLLTLYDGAGIPLHAASYTIPYNAPQWKKDGGWSLESPDPDQVCNISSLWEYSEDRSGGTPGVLNSVDGERPDYRVPVLLYYGYGEAGELWLHFSEPVDLDAIRDNEVLLNPGSFSALEVCGAGALHKTLICRFPVDPSLFSRFTFSMPAVTDCMGNLSREQNFNGGPALAPVSGSVLINEIMYDPLEGGVEYIELFNPGQNFVDLREFGIGVSSVGEIPDKILALSEWSRIMGPGDYVVVSVSVDHLRDAYGLEVSGCWLELEDNIALPDGGGQIWLTDRAGNGVDVVNYEDDMHMELISDTRGVSLERIDPGRAGSDSHNWHSAASIDNYATPGRLNSQSVRKSSQAGGLVEEPAVFSPDNDGYKDLLLINPGVEDAGSVIRLWITTLEGRMVRSLANNHVTGLTSQYSWDGRDDGGGMAPGGFYVVHLRVYNPSTGTRRNRKAAIGLIYR